MDFRDFTVSLRYTHIHLHAIIESTVNYHPWSFIAYHIHKSCNTFSNSYLVVHMYLDITCD